MLESNCIQFVQFCFGSASMQCLFHRLFPISFCPQGDPNSYQASLRETAGLARNLDAIMIGGPSPTSNHKGGDTGSAAGEFPFHLFPILLGFCAFDICLLLAFDETFVASLQVN